MAGESPTFSESWYRVASLRPRLRATLRTHRQHFRGRLWHVVQDPVNNSFFRLHAAAQRFVGLLDGRRTAAEAWRICTGQLGDEALTQNEAIQVLGQLYAANLLQADLPPDAEGLFQRYRKRRRRQARSRLGNFLFLRIPLFDPDGLLDALVGVVGLAFTPVGFLLWAALVATGAYFALGSWRELGAEAEALLGAPHLLRRLPAMYAVFVLAKVCHELGHALACKKFGRQAHSGGEVHTIGIMLLVLAPVPYVDASSAWALRRKLHRVIVGAAGMMTELALAAVAAIVWVATSDAAGPWGRGVHFAAYNGMFIASVATLLFNANPLLRFDGYYILSDVLEIPNLSSRSMLYLRYLVKRLAWGVRGAMDPAQSAGEAVWLGVYGVAAMLFRVFICVKILLMLMDRLFFVGTVLAAAAATAWVLVPFGRFVAYLVGSAELSRTRVRALAGTVLVLGAAGAGLSLLRAPDRWQVSGVVEPARLAFVHAGADGFVTDVLPSGRRVRGGADPAEGDVLVSAANRDLELAWTKLTHERDILAARQRIARRRSTEDARYLPLVQILEEDIADLERQAELLRRERAGLAARAPMRGTWLCPRADRLGGAFLRRGERIGLVADLDELVVRADVPPRLAGMLLAEANRRVELRLVGRPDAVFRGTCRILPGGRKLQPWLTTDETHAASDPPADNAATETQPFQATVLPEKPYPCPLLPGQRAVVQFELPPRPLIAQWWRSLRQLAQRRFGI